MKLKNFIAMAALALVAVSCSDDDEEVVNHSEVIAGDYAGEMVQVVMDTESRGEQTLTLKAQNDGRLTLVFPASGEGSSMSSPEIQVKDLNLVEGSNGEISFSIPSTDTIAVVNDETKKKYLYTNMRGSVKDQKLKLTYKAKMGRMPFWMDATFNGTKK